VIDMANVENMRQERAARRFAQIGTIERYLMIKLDELMAAKARVKALQQEADALVMRLRAAARDEGELPVFDMDAD
jgi:hypothetical protein